jgi:hypothetical protein
MERDELMRQHRIVVILPRIQSIVVNYSNTSRRNLRRYNARESINLHSVIFSSLLLMALNVHLNVKHTLYCVTKI